MARTRTLGSLVVAAIVAVTPIGLPASAEAHGHHGGVYVGVGFGGFYGWGPYWGWGPFWGWGWGPWPYGYGAPGGVGLGYAMMSGMGGLDLSVKPKQAEVWVDGKYFAEARDLDGDPSYLWLKGGAHHLVLYEAGFRSFEEDVEVNVGMVRELKVTLEPGESQPPVPAVPEVRSGPPRPEGTEPHAEADEPRAEAGEARSSEPRAPMAEPQGEPQGAVRLRIRPEDATVYVDGDYRGTARALQGLRLPPGHHRVEVVRPGYQPLEKEFDVEAGRPTDLALSMERYGGWKY
jgi:PEGA domain-containing protein